MLHTPRKATALLAVATSGLAVSPPSLAAEGPVLVGGPARAGSEARLSLVVPPDPRRPIFKAQLHVPTGMSIGSCSAEAQWTCRYEPRSGVGPAVIEWVRTAGASSVQTFALSLTVDQPGRYELAVTRVSAPAVTARFGSGRGAVGPPAVLEVHAPAATTTTPTTTTAADDTETDDGRGSGAAAAAVAALVAGVVAAAAFSRRRRRMP